jgi:hypothetical protein
MIVAIAVIVLLRNAPAVDVGVPVIVNIAQWLNDVPTSAAFRGILIGAGLGAIALGIRTMIGKEAGFLGRN